MKFKFYILFTIIIIAITSCFKAPNYPIEPQIEFARYEKTSDVYTLGDSGFLVLKFKDGDGDLGKLNNEDNSSRIISRNLKDSVFFFKNDTLNIPIIPNKGTSIAIDGEIKINLKDAFFSGYELYFYPRGISKDTFTFKIYITDRAQHQSNTIITPPIIVKVP